MHSTRGARIHIHGVSVGEILSAVPLIERILERQPNAGLLLTSWTETAQAQAKRLYGDHPRVSLDKLPLDLPWNHGPFYKKHNVKAAIWIDSELWPGWLLAMRKRRIPLILINGRMSERSWQRWRLAKPLIRFLLALFARIDAQSAADARRFTELGGKASAQPVNLKYLRPAPVLDARSFDFGSRAAVAHLFTHEGDETRAFILHKELKKTHPDLLTLIVPRHPHRADMLMQEAQEAGLKAVKRSSFTAADKDADILFGDTIGETGLYLALARIVVIGKSFDPAHVGGQSPIEAAQTGRAILCGPYMTNFPGVMDDLRAAGAIKELNDEKELLPALLHLLAHPQEVDVLGANARRLTTEKTKDGESYLDEVIAFLEDAK